MRPRRFCGPPAARFWPKVDRGLFCWEWTASKNVKGYGTFGHAPGKSCLAHRFSWELHNGPVPPGLYVCHRCNNRACVRPDHLYVGTQKDNMRDREAAGNTPWKNRPYPHRGDTHHATKYPDALVVEMRRAYAAGGVSQREVGRRFGVNPKTAENLIGGRKRRHIPPLREVS